MRKVVGFNGVDNVVLLQDISESDTVIGLYSDEVYLLIYMRIEKVWVWVNLDSGHLELNLSYQYKLEWEDSINAFKEYGAEIYCKEDLSPIPNFLRRSIENK